MKKRIAYLIAFFAMVLGCFLIQKPLFMLYNDAVEKGVSPADFGRVILHGFTLDATTAGYLTVIPWLVVLISIWFRQFPLRKILTGYYMLISFLVMLIFIVDMALYPFWGFKLDASIFLYMDSPKNALASVSTGFIILRIFIMLLLSALMIAGLYKLTPQRLAGTSVG
mgnify:FL=1